MTMPRSTWEQTQYNLVQDFLDLFLPPRYTFSVEANYPKTASMGALIEDRFDSLELPEKKLFRLGELLEESSLEDFPYKQADLFTLYAYNVLEGFGHGLASNLEGSAFEGLQQLATTWGSYLAKEVERLFRKWRLFAAFTDFTLDLFSIFCQIPPKELGETIRESVTPAYLRAGETVAYELALFHNDQTRMRESLGILLASDAELERQIANLFNGYSTTQVGRQGQRMLIAVVSQLRELFSSSKVKNEFDEKLPTAVLIACRNISWYIGRRLSRNLQYNPQRTNTLLEAISWHKEIPAVMEQYRHKYDWQGDRTKAIELSWQAVAPTFLYPSKRVKDIHKIEAQERLVARAQAQKVPYLSGRMEDINEDEVQLRLIGLAKGLEDYTTKNPSIQALTEGLLGKLRAYLKTAAENEEIDYLRKQETEGNIALTKAKHASDLRSTDEEEDELLDEKILSREKEKYCPSRDPIVEEIESKETVEEWYNSLTESQKTITNLKSAGYTEAEIARMMKGRARASSWLQGAATLRGQS